jgi:hypothetical protein
MDQVRFEYLKRGVVKNNTFWGYLLVYSKYSKMEYNDVLGVFQVF